MFLQPKHGQCILMALLLASVPLLAQEVASSPPTIEVAERSWTLADLEGMALANSPRLLAAQDRVQAAFGRAQQAALKPNPVIGYDSEEIGADDTAGLQGAFFEQQLIRREKLSWRSEVHRRDAQRLTAEADVARQQLLAGVRMHFWRALALQQQVELREKLARTASDMVIIAERLKNNGKLNRPDELMIIIEGRRAKLALTQARDRYDLAWRALAAQVGMPGMERGRLEGELLTESQLDYDTTLQQALQASPQVYAAAMTVEREAAAVESAAVEALPDASLRMSTQYSFESRDQVAAVEIGFELPLFDRNQGAQYAAQSELAAAQAELRQAELAIHRRHAEVFARYQTALRQVESLKTQLSDATEAYNMYQEAFALRRVGYMDVLNGQRTYFEIELQSVQVLLELRQAEAELENLLVGEMAAN